jgi:hypothetical protein
LEQSTHTRTMKSTTSRICRSLRLLGDAASSPPTLTGTASFMRFAGGSCVISPCRPVRRMWNVHRRSAAYIEESAAALISVAAELRSSLMTVRGKGRRIRLDKRQAKARARHQFPGNRRGSGGRLNPLSLSAIRTKERDDNQPKLVETQSHAEPVRLLYNWYDRLDILYSSYG